MNVLYLSGSGEHRHDYGAAFLFDGLVEVLGFDNVRDFPENPTYHLSGPHSRDSCELDADLFYPTRGSSSFSNKFELRERLMGMPDETVAVIAVSFPLDAHIAQEISDICAVLHPSIPIMAVDYSDIVKNMRQHYELLAGRPLAAYFKRELPHGADWGYPLPLSYPASRVGALDFEAKKPIVMYHATDHGGGLPGIPRRLIVSQLCRDLDDDQLDVALYPGQEKGSRPSPEEYNERKRRALVGVSWNGAINWDCSRFWNNFAFGVAQVAEYPRIQIPHMPEHGEHCIYVRNPEDVVAPVQVLVDNPAYAREMAKAGHEYFLKWHCSRARAEYLLDIVKKVA